MCIHHQACPLEHIHLQKLSIRANTIACYLKLWVANMYGDFAGDVVR